METLDQLRKDVRAHRELMLMGYDKNEVLLTDAAGMFATIDNREQRLNPIPVSANFLLPQGFALEDEPVLYAKMDQLEWQVPVKPYRTTLPFNRINVGRPQQAIPLANAVAKLGPSMRRLQMHSLFKLFRNINAVSITGQTFFNKAHPQPADQGMFSNIIDLDTDVTTTSNTKPTAEDAIIVLRAARIRFAINQLLEAEVVKDLDMPLTVVALTQGWFEAFDDVRSRPQIVMDGQKQDNPFFGKINLMWDRKHPATYSYRFLIFNGGPMTIQAGSDGRPVEVPSFPAAFLAFDTDPVPGAEEVTGNKDLFTIYNEMIFGAKLGLPQGALAGWRGGG